MGGISSAKEFTSGNLVDAIEGSAFAVLDSACQLYAISSRADETPQRVGPDFGIGKVDVEAIAKAQTLFARVFGG